MPALQADHGGIPVLAGVDRRIWPCRAAHHAYPAIPALARSHHKQRARHAAPFAVSVAAQTVSATLPIGLVARKAWAAPAWSSGKVLATWTTSFCASIK